MVEKQNFRLQSNYSSNKCGVMLHFYDPISSIQFLSTTIIKYHFRINVCNLQTLKFI